MIRRPPTGVNAARPPANGAQAGGVPPGAMPLTFKGRALTSMGQVKPRTTRVRTRFLGIPAVLMVVLLVGGCSSIGGWVSDLVKPRPQPLLPAADLYQLGETEM